MDSGPYLPQATRELLERVKPQRRHAGLQLDKLSGAGDMKGQRRDLDQVMKTEGDPALFDMLRRRRRITLDTMGASRLAMTMRGPMTLHLSRSGALENAGIALHPIYGFVYLPGSGIKGMVRAWAETVWAPAQGDADAAWRQIERAFGWSPGSERHKKAWRPEAVPPPEDAAAGSLVFHDAWPCRWPGMIIDIINNHHPGYYAGHDDAGDWENPVPVYFLAVDAGETFEFALSARSSEDADALSLAGDWLQHALVVDGAGAKTAAGYGRFEPAEGPVEAAFPDNLAVARHELRLASPAFLAGARQDRKDCDLRPATLRGLLRWWWRKMHAGHLDRAALKTLETAVWGDARSGSPIRIAVDFSEGDAPVEHPEKNDRHFLTAHDIEMPGRGQKVTQGLYYASYGMGERSSRRWYRPPGSAWRVTITARAGRMDGGDGTSIRLAPETLLAQAEVALWLLARFGGAGSRARKGFGAFDDLSVDGIASLEDCHALGARLRDDVRLVGAGETDLQTAMVMEDVPTPWRDPWFVLDRAGMALQRFAKGQLGDDRAALGLPRRIGQGREARHLTVGNLRRHASPALFSLSRSRDGLVVRLIAFPAPRLPDSAKVLRQLLDETRDFLRAEIERVPRAGRRVPPKPSPTRPGAGRPEPSEQHPENGSLVEAVLLEERTKKGGWRARHEPSGKEGHIENTANVPVERKPGDIVELYYVKSQRAFLWPTEDVRTRMQKPPKNRAPQGSRRRR